MANLISYNLHNIAARKLGSAQYPYILVYTLVSIDRDIKLYRTETDYKLLFCGISRSDWLLFMNSCNYVPEARCAPEICQQWTVSSVWLAVNYWSDQPLLKKKSKIFGKFITIASKNSVRSRSFDKTFHGFWITFWRNLLPGIRWIHESSVLDLFVDIFVLVEWKGSAQWYIYYYSYAPHVQWSIVSFIT